MEVEKLSQDGGFNDNMSDVQRMRSTSQYSSGTQFNKVGDFESEYSHDTEFKRVDDG